MAKYSDDDLHWITVHPNGKEEKPGVKVAINGAGKVVKGPKGLKDDINAEGGLPGAKSLPLDELKAKGGGAKKPGVEETAGTSWTAGTSGEESDFLSPPEGFGGLFDDDEPTGGGLVSPDGEMESLLDDDDEGKKEKVGICKNAEKWLSVNSLLVDGLTQMAGSKEALEKAIVAVGLSDDSFIKLPNGKMAVKALAYNKLLDAINAHYTPETNSATPAANFAETFADSDYAKEHYLPEVVSSLGLPIEAAMAKLKQYAKALEDGDFDSNGKLKWSGGKKILDAINADMEAMEAKEKDAPQAQATSAPAIPLTPAKPVTEELTGGGYPFPKDEKAMSSLTKVKALGGASGANATLYKDADGNLFVMKRFHASDKEGQRRIREECDADAYYLSGGANVPHFKLYGDEGSGYTKLSQFIPGTKTLGEAWSGADAEMREKITQNLRKDFALDVMAGAWDVLGTGRDNILVDGEGNVWRCDNGGAFNRRAQGGEKNAEAWGNGHVDDLWTMRGMSASLDGKKVPDGTGKAEFFGGVTTHQLLSDIASRDWEKMTAHLPDATRAVMAKRVANAKEYHAVCDNVVTAGMYGDGKHSEDVTLNYHCLNKFGAKQGCLNSLISPPNFGWCRGEGTGTPAPKLADYLKGNAPKLEDFTKSEEPTLAQFMPDPDKSAAAAKLLAAGKTINHHLFDKKDGEVNKATVEAALALKPKLEAVSAEGGADAAKVKEMLAFLGEVEKVKAGGYKNLGAKFGFAPSGEVDLNTAAAKEAAQAQFGAEHAAWEAKVKNAKGAFEKAAKAWEKKEAAAKAKLAAKTKEWEANHGTDKFKWNNLTECYDDFCKQNGIASGRFWEMAKAQGQSSQNEGSCRMKVIEILAMGGNLDHPFSSVKGVSDHSLNVKLAAEEYKSHPDWLERDRKAYVAMKSLTQMILMNSDFTGNFRDRRCVRLCRTEEDKVVVKGYDIWQGFPTVYNMGTHESFSVFKTFCNTGHEAMICDVPYSRISSLYFMKGPLGKDMYLGDHENEAGVNAIGLPKVYWKHTHSGEKLTKGWKYYEEAMKLPVIYSGPIKKAKSSLKW